MNIIDTTKDMLAVFEGDHFDIEKWKSYMDGSVPGAKELCLRDMKDCVNAGFSWEKEFVPVLRSVLREEEKRRAAIESFHVVTKDLDQRIQCRFGKTVDADLILYLGLCNGAGWATAVNGKTVVLLGLEKIMELNWYDINSMIGLIYHELGHVYQAQYGMLHINADCSSDHFLWKLFIEGIAMVFEQEIVENPGFFHQDHDGWLTWCEQHGEQLKHSFFHDLKTMTNDNQRYFGDWVRYEGYGDTGYYLGVQFVRFLLQSEHFDTIISYGINEVKAGFDRFMHVSL